jgi:two-component system, NarL family, response regulator NreC
MDCSLNSNSARFIVYFWSIRIYGLFHLNGQEEGMNLRILIADDDHYARYAFRRLTEAQHTIVSEAGSGTDAVTLALKERPDLIIMDADMPDMNGIEATRRILEKLPDVKILAVSGHSEESWVRGMLKAGAKGFILKSQDVEALPHAVDRIAAGQGYLSPGVTGFIITNYARRRNTSPRRSKLTARQREVLQLMGQGHSTKAIAKRLGVTIQAVYKHRYEIMQRLEIDTSLGLIHYAAGRRSTPDAAPPS